MMLLDPFLYSIVGPSSAMSYVQWCSFSAAAEFWVLAVGFTVNCCVSFCSFVICYAPSICLPSWGGVWVGGHLAILCFLSCPELVLSTDLLQLGLVRRR